MSIELKIKSKHLSEEARIIRFEEQKLLQKVNYSRQKHYATGNNEEYRAWEDKHFQDYCSLNRHRKWNVRNENRATFLARAYIAGVPYSTVEQKRENEFLFRSQIFPRICAMVVKYGKREQGDVEWEKGNPGRYVATKQLKDKIATWCNVKQ
jgi:hypothetical protein